MENQKYSPEHAQNDDRPQGQPEPIYADSGNSGNVGSSGGSGGNAGNADDQASSGFQSQSDHDLRNQNQIGSEQNSPRAAGGEGDLDDEGDDDAMDDDMDDDGDDEMLPDSENPDRPDRPGQPMA